MNNHYQDTVNRVITENNPYIVHEPLRFNLRAYPFEMIH